MAPGIVEDGESKSCLRCYRRTGYYSEETRRQPEKQKCWDKVEWTIMLTTRTTRQLFKVDP